MTQPPDPNRPTPPPDQPDRPPEPAPTPAQPGDPVPPVQPTDPTPPPAAPADPTPGTDPAEPTPPPAEPAPPSGDPAAQAYPPAQPDPGSQPYPAQGYPAQGGPPGGPAQPAPTANDPGKVLGIVGLILAFFCAVVGLVISIIGFVKSRKAGFTNIPAIIGMIVGVLVTIGWIIGGIAIGGVAAKCAELGPGVHQEGGATYRCG